MGLCCCSKESFGGGGEGGGVVLCFLKATLISLKKNSNYF